MAYLPRVFDTTYSNRHELPPMEETLNPIKKWWVFSLATIVAVGTSCLAGGYCSMWDPALDKITVVFFPPSTCIVPSSTTNSKQKEWFPGQLNVDFSVSCKQNIWSLWLQGLTI